MTDSPTADLNTKFKKLAIDENKSKEIQKNKKVTAALSEIIDDIHSGDVTPKASALLQTLATKSKDATDEQKRARKLVVDAVVDERLRTAIQLTAAWDYVKTAGSNATVEQLDKESGVGIVITEDQVAKAVDHYIELNKPTIVENRYKHVPAILNGVKSLPEMRWANPALFKPIIDQKVLELLGPKDERDTTKAKPKKKEGSNNNNGKKQDDNGGKSVRSMFSEGFLGALHKPGENAQAYPEKMKEHLEFTKGQVFTRFPPEPNGYLHIGHSKAITVNFGYAKFHDGKCYLRFDDTNPKSEEDVYVKSIIDTVDWLGFTPYKITYSSDYFDQLYTLAEKLINKDLGYVCFCSAEQLKANRGISEDGGKGGKRTACEHRSASVETNLQEFRNMRDGKYKPGEAILRMKQDLDNPNTEMWDVVAYRVIDEPHHRTGTKWKIYPTYQFTHCLVDSMENISHSLCTLEFYLAREAYEWLCDAVEVYRPAQREYGRLNVTGSVMSKRKIMKLVNEGFVRGWDDPRLLTLVGIRRRGVPPGAVLSFVAELGVTTSHTFIQVSRFENSIRKYLENHTPRLMMVLDPVMVVLDNVDDSFCEELTVEYMPKDKSMGERKLPFTKRFFIERSDFRETEPDADYFRLAPGQPVGLNKVPYNVRYVSCEKDSNGRVTVIHAHYENDVEKKVKPKTFIHWVPIAPAYNSPVELSEVRVHNQLFKSENPEDNPDGFLADVAEDSEVLYKNAVIEPAISDVKAKSPWKVESDDREFTGKETPGSPESIRFQALRVGYFCLDKDSTEDKWVLNRIVTLKEDSSKK